MIKFITGSGPHLQVQTYGSTPYINSGNASAGMMRYHNNEVQVYDGSSWLTVSGHTEISLSSDANAAIEWCKRKIIEEERLKELMERHPGLRDAYEKFEIMRMLVTEEEQQNG